MNKKENTYSIVNGLLYGVIFNLVSVSFKLSLIWYLLCVKYGLDCWVKEIVFK